MILDDDVQKLTLHVEWHQFSKVILCLSSPLRSVWSMHSVRKICLLMRVWRPLNPGTPSTTSWTTPTSASGTQSLRSRWSTTSTSRRTPPQPSATLCLPCLSSPPRPIRTITPQSGYRTSSPRHLAAPCTASRLHSEPGRDPHRKPLPKPPCIPEEDIMGTF